MRRLAAAGVAAMWLSVVWSAPPSPVPAAGAGTGEPGGEEHRAAVIVDTGTQVKSVCVRFKEESITGVEALTRAQVDPVFQAFSGKGAAVCALCGVGCPAGESCLTCNAEGRFWSYSRAPAGAGALRTSGVGASATTVRDGDVEGWRWGLGGTPPFATVEQVCGEVGPAPPPPTSTAPASAPTAPGPATSPGPGSPAPATTRSPAPAAPAAPRLTTTAPLAAAATAPGAPAAAAPPAPTGDLGSMGGRHRLAPSPTAGRGGDGAGNWPGLAAFGAALAGLLGWGAWARRSRRGGIRPR